MKLSAIFLSASIPLINSGTYHIKADPDLINFAVQEFVKAATPEYQIVCGCDPLVTHTIVDIFKASQADPNLVTLYQSAFFEDCYPEENLYFENIISTALVPGGREANLLHMRKEMLSRKDLVGAVFIGGMDAVETEYQIFKHFHPQGKILPILSSGGGALNLALDHGSTSSEAIVDNNVINILSTFLAELKKQ